MAGEGSRFRNAGYPRPKHEIEVQGRTLFAWSMSSLREFADVGCQFIFVARSHDNTRDFISAHCRDLGIHKFNVAFVDRLTDGQATTVLHALPLCGSQDSPMAVYNIDTYFNPAALDTSSIRAQGWLPCFPGEGDKWSFAAADETGRVSELREKQRISRHATVGLYWFDSFNRYKEAYGRYYSHPSNASAQERYVAPIYNQIIRDGGEVFIQTIPRHDVYPLGTPEDVRLFERGLVCSGAARNSK